MLYLLTQKLTPLYSAFNVFGYLTLRAILAALTALLISFLVGPWMIRTFAEKQIGQRVIDQASVQSGTSNRRDTDSSQSTSTSQTGITFNAQGGNEAHPIVPPGLALNYIIKF